MIAIPPLKTPIPSPMARPVPRPLKIDPSCVFYWDGIDKISTVKVLDESGNNNHGTITSATYVPDGLLFDGIADFVVIPDDNSLDITDEITSNSWIKRASLGIFESVIGKHLAYSTFPRIENNDRIMVRLYWDDATDTGELEDFRSEITDSDWHMVTISFSSTDGYIRIYIDGNETASWIGYTGKKIDTNANSVRIGRRHTFANYFNGTIAEVAIFNRALSAVEINNLYLLGKARLGV